MVLAKTTNAGTNKQSSMPRHLLTLWSEGTCTQWKFRSKSETSCKFSLGKYMPLWANQSKVRMRLLRQSLNPLAPLFHHLRRFRSFTAAGFLHHLSRRASAARRFHRSRLFVNGDRSLQSRRRNLLPPCPRAFSPLWARLKDASYDFSKSQLAQFGVGWVDGILRVLESLPINSSSRSFSCSRATNEVCWTLYWIRHVDPLFLTTLRHGVLKLTEYLRRRSALFFIRCHSFFFFEWINDQIA